MPVKKVLVEVLECGCNECSHRWTTGDSEIPTICPSCNSTEWNEVWEVAALPSKDIEELSYESKKRLESQKINESRRKQAEKPRRKIIQT